MNKKTIRDIDVAGKRVLVRVDFNVPLDAERHITDDTRIKAALPTINYLLDAGAAVILMSHLGRPDGKVVDKLRLAPVAQRLGELLGKPVQTATDCIGPQVEAQAKALQPGQVLLLENLRFHKEEEKNDPEFARQLASLGDLYVNDAFGTAHRAHASTEGVTHTLPGVAGFLLEKEINFLGSAPTDVAFADRFAADADHKVVASSAVPQGWRILDIGPATIESFRQALSGAQTIVWNGTLGVAEFPEFARGTDALIEILAERTKAGALTIIGGGDSAAAVEQAGAADKMTHVSTGGGASLEFLEGRTLPGVAALQDKG